MRAAAILRPSIADGGAEWLPKTPRTPCCILRRAGRLGSGRDAARGGIRAKGAPPLTGTLLRPDVVVASEQVFPDVGEVEILHPAGALSPARVAGRDPGTNIVALRLDIAVEVAPPALAEPVHGGLALILSA